MVKGERKIVGAKNLIPGKLLKEIERSKRHLFDTMTNVSSPWTILSLRLSRYSRHSFRTAKEWNRRQVECDKCGIILSAASLNKHLETQHGVFWSRVLNRDFLLNVGELETYTAHANTSGSFLGLFWHGVGSSSALPWSSPVGYVDVVPLPV